MKFKLTFKNTEVNEHILEQVENHFTTYDDDDNEVLGSSVDIMELTSKCVDIANRFLLHNEYVTIEFDSDNKDYCKAIYPLQGPL